LALILRFGKFKGWHVDEVPLSYLAWIFESLTGKPEVQEAALAEIRRRVSGYELEAEPLNMERVKRVYRTLALQYHPDRNGGNGEAMKAINSFYAAINKHEDR
jgi:uncharacterized protein (DUF3820 family)